MPVAYEDLKMNKYNTALVGLLLWSFVGGLTVRSQTVKRQDPVWQQLHDLSVSKSKLEVTTKLDRDIYFPGEDAQVTIVVANPTAQILEVPTPFDLQTGFVHLYVRGTGSLQNDWVETGSLVSGHGIVEVGKPVVPPTTWISPVQPLTRTFWLSEAGCNHHIVPYVGPCQLEETEGEFRLWYTYGANAYATFRVVWPQFEHWAEAVLAKRYQYEEVLPNKVKTGNIRTLPRRVRAMVLGYQGNHFVAVSNDVVTAGSHIWQDSSGKLVAAMNRQFGIYRRIATSTIPITSLQVTADNAENVTINYTDQSGRQFTLNLDANHRLISKP
jgi:hypothetical protein